MNSRKAEIIEQYRTLQQQGWLLQGHQSQIEPNTGSETTRHMALKAITASVLINEGYHVRSEVECTHDKQSDYNEPVADIVAFGHPSREPVVVELETECDGLLRETNAEKYGIGVREVFTVEIPSVPSKIEAAEAYIKTRLGL